MKPKLICDNCSEDLKEVMENDDEIYIINDGVGGCSVMEHNNCKKHIVICEECYEEFRDKLIDEGCWIDLDNLDNTPDMKKDFFQNFDDLKEYIDMLNREEN